MQTHMPLGATTLDLLAVPLDLNFFRNLHGLLRLPVEPMLGAGLVVYAEGTDILDQAVNFTEFYRNESCGKCIPCRLGSQKLVQIGTELMGHREAGTKAERSRRRREGDHEGASAHVDLRAGVRGSDSARDGDGVLPGRREEEAKVNAISGAHRGVT